MDVLTSLGISVYTMEERQDIKTADFQEEPLGERRTMSDIKRKIYNWFGKRYSRLIKKSNIIRKMRRRHLDKKIYKKLQKSLRKEGR